jgi:putative endonuclease
MTFYFYVLQSETTGRFYIGHTENLSKRIFEHNNKRTPSTKNRGPWVLFHSEEYPTRSEAARRERHVKGMKSRGYIEALARASRSDREGR